MNHLIDEDFQIGLILVGLGFSFFLSVSDVILSSPENRATVGLLGFLVFGGLGVYALVSSMKR